VTVYLIGETTYTSDWVDWEIRTARQLGKRVIGVRLRSDPSRDRVPTALSEVGARIFNWVIDDIVRALG
jgi:hypothetical protein